jgi:hypothetical protein
VAGTKIDVVVVAARYAAEDGRLILAQGYERRGVVWSDVGLFDRQTLVERLESGMKIVTGRPKELAGDFEFAASVELAAVDGKQTLVAEGRPAHGDDLGVPLF